MAAAMRSLPVPVSPVSRTVALVGATWSTSSSVRRIEALEPMICAGLRRFLDFVAEVHVLVMQPVLQLLEVLQRCPELLLRALALRDLDRRAEDAIHRLPGRCRERTPA